MDDAHVNVVYPSNYNICELFHCPIEEINDVILATAIYRIQLKQRYDMNDMMY